MLASAGREKVRKIRTPAVADRGGLDALEVHREVVHEVLAVGVVHDLLVQRARLLKVDCDPQH